jgi:gentisate 1,2-dioxygenase
VYHVIEGSGYTTIDGKKYSWRQGATFCVPAWQEYQHFADKDGKVYLYRFDDRPMLKALGFYRVDGVDVESLVSD